MEIKKVVSEASYELQVMGRIDGAGANQLEIESFTAVASKAKTVYVNLSQATFLCSAGLRVLLQNWRQMKNAGRKFLVSNPSPEVDSVLRMTGFREEMVEGARPAGQA